MFSISEFFGVTLVAAGGHFYRIEGYSRYKSSESIRTYRSPQKIVGLLQILINMPIELKI